MTSNRVPLPAVDGAEPGAGGHTFPGLDPRNGRDGVPAHGPKGGRGGRGGVTSDSSLLPRRGDWVRFPDGGIAKVLSASPGRYHRQNFDPCPLCDGRRPAGICHLEGDGGTSGPEPGTVLAPEERPVYVHCDVCNERVPAVPPVPGGKP